MKERQLNILPEKKKKKHLPKKKKELSNIVELLNCKTLVRKCTWSFHCIFHSCNANLIREGF